MGFVLLRHFCLGCDDNSAAAGHQPSGGWHSTAPSPACPPPRRTPPLSYPTIPLRRQCRPRSLPGSHRRAGRFDRNRGFGGWRGRPPMGLGRATLRPCSVLLAAPYIPPPNLRALRQLNTNATGESGTMANQAVVGGGADGTTIGRAQLRVEVARRRGKVPAFSHPPTPSALALDPVSPTQTAQRRRWR